MKKYESPDLVFVETELFEDVAAECWANPSLYMLVDPTDEDKSEGGSCMSSNGNMRYVDLVGFKDSTNGNGCNGSMKGKVESYVLNHYGKATEKRGHYMTESDIKTVMASGGGNDGTSLKDSNYVFKVRSN